MTMPCPPHKTLLATDELFGCRDLRLQDRTAADYPHLLRLCCNFNFSVLQLQRKFFSHLSRKMVPGAPEFMLAIRDDLTQRWCAMTPGLTSLVMLDDYAKHHEVDLLHLHLFGDADDDFNQFTESGFY